MAAMVDSETFVLCDLSSSRLPILHASPGFQKMYGQGGNSFLDVLEVKATPENLYEVANRQLGFVEIDNGMDFLASEVKNYAQAAMQEQPEHPLLFINQKSCGQLFTCEMQLTQKHHPSLGWSYLVATHRDVTSALPVSEVLKAAQSPSSYSTMCTRWAQNGAGAALPKVQKNSDKDFHQIVHDAWREKITKTLVDENSCGKPEKLRSAEEQTIASVSTACSMSSVARKTDVSQTSENAKGFERSPWSPWSPRQPCFHLGALARSDVKTKDESTERSDSEDRDRNLFLELDEDVQCEELPEALCCSPLCNLPFSFFILDPRHQELPIVLGSHKFACETTDDLLLTSFDSLFLNAKCPTTSAKDLAAFWEAGRQGEFIEELTGGASFGEVVVEADLHSRSGELIPCTLTLKQVELDDVLFVAGVSHPTVLGAQKQNDISMDEAIQVMASEFFFSAPMRRQIAVER